ncbi:uncharacterized protein PHALS_13093 [Plasmopara halstedii]|uniref:Uncharacterized protein n=1 Tax=Plasmopara halstedii TaxID=4781 RepID=A0A0P1AP33_PLAHL|nr:uncharacterized protein PHALS_13093 [Plasmopara halstedii]CEG42853.1 hypothetical protein PHALS_13093 [Plasmopara halstedii]|eukprot:XP_024579222.1 hypothetical protein PHALS_13093 [Plasmopara halstedii]
MGRYRAQLRAQKGGVPVPAMLTIPVVLTPGKTATDDDELFERWVQRHRKPFSLSTLQQSNKELDVRVERHLRFEFSKFKAQRRLPTYCRPETHVTIHNASASSVVSHEGGSTIAAFHSHCLSSAHGLSASRATVEKSCAHGDARRHDLSDHKRLRRLGSLTEVTSQIPTNSRSLGIPTTSQDIGLNPADDVDPQGISRGSGRHHSHQKEKAADDDDLIDRQAVNRDALRALEDKVRRHRHSAEHLSDVAVR